MIQLPSVFKQKNERMTTTPEQKIETHPFVYFLPENPRLLIVGSFPGWEQVENKETEWFYTAKRNQFWSILSAVFKTDLTTLESKKNLCSKEGIAITDIFLKIKRKGKSNLDISIEPLEYNHQKIKWILENSSIKSIFFTSKYVEKHFQLKFPEVLNTQCLLSPSRAASIPISISEEYKNYKIDNPKGDTKSFRILKYTELLNSSL